MKLHDVSRRILEWGLFLCILLMAGAVALLLRAEEGGALAPRFAGYAAAFHFSAQVALGCGTAGCALAEDILRRGEE